MLINKVIEATRSIILKKSPPRIKRLLTNRSVPIKTKICKGIVTENIINKRTIAATKSMNPKILTKTI